MLSGMVLKDKINFDTISFSETPPPGLLACSALTNTRLVYIRDCNPALSALATNCAPIVCQRVAIACSQWCRKGP